MRRPQIDAAWSNWYDATTAANWQTCLATLTGYTSTEGFMVRVRLVTSTAVAARFFNYASMTLTPDAAWVPAEIGFVPINVSGYVSGSTQAIRQHRPGNPGCLLVSDAYRDDDGA